MTSQELREEALMIELRCRAELMNAETKAEAEYYMKLAEAKATYAQNLAAQTTALLVAKVSQETDEGD